MLKHIGNRILGLGQRSPVTAARGVLPRLYHERVVDHYNNPRNVGSFDKNDPTVGTGLVGAPACGDVMKLQIKVDEEGKITDACFKTFGCGSAIASSSVATEWVKGRQMEEVLSIKNTGTLLGKYVELVKILKKRRINIACVQETKWVGSKARDVDGYKLLYSCSERRRNGVGILVDEELRGQVVEVNGVSDRPMTIKLVIWGSTLHVCSVYALQVGLDEEVKARFWEALDEVVRSMPSLEKIVIAGDFNGHIEVLPGCYDDVHGGFGFDDRNGDGVALLNFARAFGLVVVNLSFPKKEIT
ncbi:Iron-sulfur cluster assembly enzyme ISCU, mitochondrial [Capsicum annuum]|nr:Iron-sulfur cluster assembly enzyme ISCU, mitochondrial [Capsicum annuum]